MMSTLGAPKRSNVGTMGASSSRRVRGFQAAAIHPTAQRRQSRLPFGKHCSEPSINSCRASTRSTPSNSLEAIPVQPSIGAALRWRFSRPASVMADEGGLRSSHPHRPRASDRHQRLRLRVNVDASSAIAFAKSPGRIGPRLQHLREQGILGGFKPILPFSLS